MYVRIYVTVIFNKMPYSKKFLQGLKFHIFLQRHFLKYYALDILITISHTHLFVLDRILHVSFGLKVHAKCHFSDLFSHATKSVVVLLTELSLCFLYKKATFIVVAIPTC